jgi:hypothetical protein
MLVIPTAVPRDRNFAKGEVILFAATKGNAILLVQERLIAKMAYIIPSQQTLDKIVSLLDHLDQRRQVRTK